MKKILNRERITAVVIFLFGLAVYLGASAMKKSPLDPVGPGVFPKVVAVAMMFISVIHFLISGNVEAGEKEELHWKNVAILAVMVALYILLFPRIGFPIATSIFLFVFSTIFDPRPMAEKWKANLIFSICFMAVLYLIFKVMLGIMLPTILIGR